MPNEVYVLDAVRTPTGKHRGELAAGDDEVVPVPCTDLTHDESIPTTPRQTAGKLASVFRPNGTVTVDNSSPLNDGSSALLLGNHTAADSIGAALLARLAVRAVTAFEPRRFGVGPVEAARIALDRAGSAGKTLSVVELNEAFAASRWRAWLSGTNWTRRSSTPTVARSRSAIRSAPPDGGSLARLPAAARGSTLLVHPRRPAERPRGATYPRNDIRLRVREAGCVGGQEAMMIDIALQLRQERETNLTGVC